MAFFDSAGVKIHYEEYGSGEPAVLVHGFAASAEANWVTPGCVDSLKPHFRVITLDCRGHGQSDKPHDPAAYGSEMEDDVIRLMDHLGVQRTRLMGYSMGGRISAGLLVRFPERFQAVVLGGFGVGAQMRDPARQKAIAQALLAGDSAAIADETAKGFRAFAEANHNDLKALAACMSADREPIDPAAFARNKVPVELVVGTKDEAIGSARKLRDMIAGARLVEIEGRHHLNAPGDQRYKDAALAFFRNAPA